MALFNPLSLSVEDDNKITSYLYKLNEDLVYMFNNLTPEENFSSEAYNLLKSDSEKVAEFSVSLNGIFQNYLKGDSLIASIALDDSGVTIEADKISLEGLVTANNNFMILTDGSIVAKNGTFSGNIDGANITGSTISGKGATGEFYIGVNSDNNIELLLGSFSIAESTRGTRTLYGLFGNNVHNSDTTASFWEDGTIWCSDIYCDNIVAPEYTSSSSWDYSEDWFAGWSIQQTLIALWNCARSHGWNPGNFDPYDM